MEFQSVYKQYQPGLVRVDELLRSAVQSNNPHLTASATKLLDAGGKRIRPLFALICGQLGASHSNDVDAVASALELVHMATLVHDDVIDDSLLRRGKPTVRAQFGNRAAMYTGDFLFARAIQILCTIHNPTVHRVMSDAMVRLCEGEIEQIRDFFNFQQSLRNYLRRIERKTALLISVSCSLSALVSQSQDNVVRAMRQFGYYTGMAFQIIDDILDFTGQQDVVGKPVGGDLRQGNLTLPTLFTLSDPADAPRMKQLVHAGADDEAFTEAIAIVRKGSALSKSRDVARLYLEKALQQLEVVENPVQKQQLMTVAQFINQRLY